ncbi:protein GRIM REAPER-like [Rosa sericea]
MKLLHIFALLATMAVVSAAFDLEDYNEEPEVQSNESTVPESEMQEATTSLRGVSRFLTSQQNLTCNKFPRVCRLKKSPGPDCCKKKCVNVKTDKLNCGFCGRKCKQTEICCKGKCVNVKTDKLNCGVCGYKCKYPGICCKGKCVNVKTDKLNCGICGYKCKYPEICCKGKCVNPTCDKKNCGGCNKKCKRGELCVYGMCNYA